MGPMQELADYGTDFGQFQPPPPLPPQPPSQAEQRRLQQYLDHRNRVDADEGEANIDSNTAEAARQQLDQAAAPLMAKASEWEQYQKQQQRAQVTDEMAFGQSIKRANMAHDAEGFHQAVSSFVDPMTGNHAYFFQPEPGKFEQMDMAPATGAEGLGDTSPAPDTGEGDAVGTGSAGQAEQPGQGETPQVTSNPDGSQQMTIWNGSRRTEAVFGPNGKLQGQQEFGPDGRPVQSAGQGGPNADYGIPPERMSLLRNQAWLASGGDRVAFHRIMPQLVQKELAYQLQTQRQTAQTKALESKQQATEVAKQKHEVAAEERQWRKDAISDVNKEFADARKAHAKDPTNKIPDYLATPEARSEEAKRRFDETMGHMREDSPQATETAAAKQAAAARAKDDPLTPAQHINRGDEWTPQTGWVNKQAEQTAPARVADVHQVIHASGLPDEQKSSGLEAANTIKSVIAKYGSLDKAPEDEKRAAQEAAKKLDKTLTEAKKKRAKPLENAGLQGFLN